MLVARVLGGLGRTLIGAGLLILLFVAYQLWGTGIHEARAQSSLENEFEASLDGQPVDPVSNTASETTVPPPPPPPDDGEAVARIAIPKLGVDKIVVEGVSLDDLKRGPGHYSDTPLPGQPGNAAIAGHRTTYGAPFENIDQLSPGDEILVTTLQGQFRYEVMAQEIVSPGQVEVLEDFQDNRLTLTACHPKFSARDRIVVTARLADDPAPAAGGKDGLPNNPTEEELETAAGEATAADEGLSGEQAAQVPALLWGLGAALVLVATWLAGRFWRRWIAYLIGAPVFFVVLFVFFENFARLLPSNY